MMGKGALLVDTNIQMISNMSHTQPQAEIDQYMQEESWMSYFPEVPETYLPSVFDDCLEGTNYNDLPMQLHGSADNQYEQHHVYEGSSGYHYPLLDEVNTAQTGWNCLDTSQVWLQQDGYKLNQSTLMESLNVDHKLVDITTGPSYEPRVRDTVFPDHSEYKAYLPDAYNTGCPRPDDQGLGIETSSRQDQEDKGKVDIMQEYRHVITDYTACPAEHKQESPAWTSRSNQWVNKYIVKQVNGASFEDSNGALVDCLGMTTIRDIAAFLGCARNTVTLALKRTGNKKGIVFGVWKVKKIVPSNPVEVDSLVASGEKSSCSQTQMNLQSMAPNTLFSNSSSLQLIARWDSSMTVTQSSGSATNHHPDPIALTCLTTLHSNQTQHLHSNLQTIASGQTLLDKYKMKSFTGGPAVKLYHVSKKHGEVFKVEGELVSSTVLMTDSNVAKLTGATRATLEKAKLHTSIELDVWMISYLGKVHPGEEMSQEILERVNTIPGRISSSGLGHNQSCQDQNWEISHRQLMHICNCDQHNQHEACEIIHKSIPLNPMVPESSLASVYCSDDMAGMQSLAFEDSIGSQKGTRKNPKTPLIPTNARIKIRQRQRYQLTRAKKSIPSANAKVFHIERVNGSLFKFNGRLVAFANIQTISAVTKFLNCAVSTLYDSLKAEGREKGIVKEFWRVTRG